MICCLMIYIYLFTLFTLLGGPPRQPMWTPETAYVPWRHLMGREGHLYECGAKEKGGLQALSFHVTGRGWGLWRHLRMVPPRPIDG